MAGAVVANAAVVATFSLVPLGLLGLPAAIAAYTVELAAFLAAVAGLGLAFARPDPSSARRAARRILPGVEDTPAHRAGRRREVYRATLEGVAGGGEVTARERAMRERLRRSLALSEGDAEALEREVLAAERSAGPAAA